jgi:hypothetical protein
MSSQQKTEALTAWHQSLDSPEGWRNIGAHYRYLMQLADRLLGLGQIDPMERFELTELASAAFCHFIEEQPAEWRHPASEYDVYNSAGEQVGSVVGNRYFLHGAGTRPGEMEFFAQIQVIDGKRLVIARTYAHYGELVDRYIFTGTGQKLTLVERCREFQGVSRTRLDDPDTYRAIVDAALVALEEGDIPKYAALWERENFSIYRQCATCMDRFDLREDCSVCDGQGFIVDPSRPDALSAGSCVASVKDDAI